MYAKFPLMRDETKTHHIVVDQSKRVVSSYSKSKGDARAAAYARAFCAASNREKKIFTD